MTNGRVTLTMKNTTTVLSRHLPSLAVGALALLGGLLATAAVADAPEAREPTEVYRQVCAHCHASDKAVGPEITMPFPEAAHEARGNYIRMVVRNGRAAMPSFREAEISDAELGALTDALLSGDLADDAGEE